MNTVSCWVDHRLENTELNQSPLEQLSRYINFLNLRKQVTPERDKDRTCNLRHMYITSLKQMQVSKNKMSTSIYTHLKQCG